MAEKGWLSVSNKYRHVATIPDGDVFQLVKKYDPIWYENLVSNIRGHLHRCSNISIVETLTMEEYIEFRKNGGQTA